ncbi:hypothetical protein [Algoriphagus marincola]|uniref:hypothetical protein n=1 Tax=Algoriphagus marincola TaxID=264027 RepID=UPI00047B2499|nr:hypothetical protein [Algoriphagus marincola]
MKKLPGKFYRIITDGFGRLLRFCAGRKHGSQPTHTNQKPMEIHLLVRQFDSALQGLEYWQNERKKLGDLLVAPRMDWAIHSHTNMVKNFYGQLVNRIDELIPDKKLYRDLYESA